MNKMTMDNTERGNRRSIRLKGYDYSLPGYYFITICLQDRACLLGEIIEGNMILNDAGHMINKWWAEIPNKFSDIALDTFVVMPNHFHAIVINTGLYISPVGAEHDASLEVKGEHIGLPLQSSSDNGGEPNIKGEYIATTLKEVVQWFKTMTSNDYIRAVKQQNWPEFKHKLWQRNYYEHIIRNEEDYNTTREYIASNPLNWNKDMFHD